MHMCRHTVLSLDIRILVMDISLFAENYFLASKSISVGIFFQINKSTQEFIF